jgi:uncharacterized integral membrane protein (TIGR00698 family)
MENAAVRLGRTWRVEPGALAATVALAATTAAGEGLGLLVPFVGAPAFALLVGVAVRTRFEPYGAGARLLRIGSRGVLQIAIVLLGATFGLAQVARVGRSSLPLMLGTLFITLAVAYLAGRALGVGDRLRTLVGVGTGICGASAIGAVSGVIGAAEAEIAYAISTIFVFNVVAVALYPAIGHALSLGQHTFGFWAGTAVNDTSSVVAAASTYGHAAAQVAVVTKLARTTMIVPIVLVLALLDARRAGAVARRPVWRLLPAFLLWFLVAAALNSLGLVNARMSADAGHAATLLIAVALAAIGLSTPLSTFRKTGWRPLALGAILWAVIGLSGLVLQTVL